jgi:hypothetical protein
VFITKQTALVQYNITQVYFNSAGYFDTCATCFGLQLCHLQAYQYKHLRKDDKTGKRKEIPTLAWTGPEGSRKMRLPDFKTIDTKVVRLSAQSFGRLHPQEIFLLLISVRGWVDSWHIVRPEGLCQWKSDSKGNRTCDLSAGSVVPRQRKINKNLRGPLFIAILWC